ncbi:MAG: hypothetical protein ACI3XE_00310 [Eubacteriales bacterium]
MEQTKKRIPRVWKILIIIAVSLLALVGLLLLGVRMYFRLPVSSYYKASEKAFVIPDPDGDFVAQGLEYDAANSLYLVTGYKKGGGASPVYCVGADGKLQKSVQLAKTDGTPCDCHAGGLALAGEFLYLAGGADGCLYVYRYTDLMNASDGASISAVGTLSTAVSEEDCLGPVCVHAFDGHLLVGEFYRETVYPTPENHHLTTTAGETHKALALTYPLDSTSPIGVSETPDKAYSLPDQVQGMYVSDGKIYLSTSWGLSKSVMYCYDLGRAAREPDLTVLGVTLPCYALDATSLVSEVYFPPMAEEILVLNGKLYTMTESASSKYIFGKFTGGKWCYATDLSYFDEQK